MPNIKRLVDKERERERAAAREMELVNERKCMKEEGRARNKDHFIGIAGEDKQKCSGRSDRHSNTGTDLLACLLVGVYYRIEALTSLYRLSG